MQPQEILGILTDLSALALLAAATYMALFAPYYSTSDRQDNKHTALFLALAALAFLTF